MKSFESLKIKEFSALILVSFPLFTILFPTIRLATIPIRVEDVFIVFLFLFSFLFIQKKAPSNVKFLFMITLLLSSILIITAFIELILQDNLNLKTLVYGMSFVKYIIFIAIFAILRDDIKKFDRYFISIIKFLLYLQVFVITFQKFGLLGFSNGFMYDFIVRHYAIPSIYATSTDVQQVMSTHMNFAFRPAGIIGSSTITGMVMLLFSYFLYMKTSLIRFKLIGIYSILITFSKIALLAFIIIEFIIPLFAQKRGKIKKFISLFIFILLVYFASSYLGTEGNLQNAIGGEDRGVWHRLFVVHYVFSQDIYHIFLGNYGPTLSFPFDSGILLTIFRHGLIFLILEYIIIYFLLYNLSASRDKSFSFIFIIFLADLTFGSVFNPIFSGIIMAIFLMSFSLRRSNEKNIIHS